MLCIGASVDSISRRINQHFLTITLAEQLKSAPISKVVMISRQYDNSVGSLRLVHNQVITGATYEEDGHEYNYCHNNEDSWDLFFQGERSMIAATQQSKS
jgi:hypothetical protein